MVVGREDWRWKKSGILVKLWSESWNVIPVSLSLSLLRLCSELDLRVRDEEKE